MKMDKYINSEGKVGVLVSYGFGAGWSTWNGDDNMSNQFYAMDKKLVEMKLNGSSVDEVKDYCEGDSEDKDYVYMGGWSSVEVEYLEPGTSFIIGEYDGSESLETVESVAMMA